VFLNIVENEIKNYLIRKISWFNQFFTY